MTRLYVVGGRQRPGAHQDVEDWHHYGTAVIVEVDVDTGVVEPRVEYVTPPDACSPDDPSITFKTATLDGDRMYVPTETELLVFDAPSFERVGYVALPCFNDVHHVLPSKTGSLLVANTGLDMVVDVDLSGKVYREWSTAGEELWTRFSRDVDYRKVFSTKPHKSHPNFVSIHGDDIWVTRCNQGDMLCLTNQRDPVNIADMWIHDGLVRDGRAYFTAVHGHIIELDTETMTVSRRFDLNALSGGGVPLGWCRGIEVIDGDRVLVGFSRLRPTKWKQYVGWAKHRMGGSGQGLLPTRVAMFDLRREEFLWELDLEPAGVNVIFSIHGVPDAWRTEIPTPVVAQTHAQPS